MSFDTRERYLDRTLRNLSTFYPNLIGSCFDRQDVFLYFHIKYSILIGYLTSELPTNVVGALSQPWNLFIISYHYLISGDILSKKLAFGRRERSQGILAFGAMLLCSCSLRTSTSTSSSVMTRRQSITTSTTMTT